LGKRESYDIHLSPAPHMTHADDPIAPVVIEYVPAQHRHASEDRHEPVRVAVLHHLPLLQKHHARMLHLSSVTPFAAHSSRTVRKNLTSPLYLPLSTYILVEHPPPKYSHILGWVRGHDIPRDQHAPLTCRAVGTICLSLGGYDGEFACAAPTCISRQT
jgi:hypothetical protein